MPPVIASVPLETVMSAISVVSTLQVQTSQATSTPQAPTLPPQQTKPVMQATTSSVAASSSSPSQPPAKPNPNPGGMSTGPPISSAPKKEEKKRDPGTFTAEVDPVTGKNRAREFITKCQQYFKYYTAEYAKEKEKTDFTYRCEGGAFL